MAEKDDRCFAYIAYIAGHCEILKNPDCSTCKFHKTRAQLLEERQRSTRRLESLHLGRWVREKYGGSRVW